MWFVAQGIFPVSAAWAGPPPGDAVSTASGNSAAGSAKSSESKGDALRLAIAALAKEYEAAITNKSSIPRDRSNYFTEKTETGVQPEEAAAQLARSVPGDARQQAYIKWQLLSAIPVPTPEKLVPKLDAAYESAPVPPPRPTSSRAEQQRISQISSRTQPQDIDSLNANFQQGIATFQTSIQPIMSYRDDLFSRLPPNVNTFTLGIKDLYERAQAGLDTGSSSDHVFSTIQNWAAGGDARPADLSRTIGLLRTLAKQKGPDYYTKVWVNNNVAQWDTRQEDFSQSQSLNSLIKFLTGKLENPDGGLQFKAPLGGK